MESFLNGRQTVAKVIAGKGNENVPTQSLEQWTVPEPGSANPGDKNSGEAHIVAGGEGQPKVELVMVDGEQVWYDHRDMMRLNDHPGDSPSSRMRDDE